MEKLSVLLNSRSQPVPEILDLGLSNTDRVIRGCCEEVPNRLEACFVIAFWVATIHFLQWQFSTLLYAYAAFAFSWSSLQWIYHVRTPLHPVEGAYDLRSPLFVRLFFLNFNYNLSHHRHPHLPWQELQKKIIPNETQPLWYRYLLIFLPPEPMPLDTMTIQKTYF